MTDTRSIDTKLHSGALRSAAEHLEMDEIAFRTIIEESGEDTTGLNTQSLAELRGRAIRAVKQLREHYQEALDE